MAGGRDLKSVGDVIAQSEALRAGNRISWHDWRQVVGSKVALRSRPDRIEDGTLWVTVTSATWAQELSLLQRTIIGRLSGSGPKISKLRFNVGKVDALRQPVVRSAPQLAALPPELQATLDAVEDPQLKQAIREAAGYNLGLNRE